MRKFDRTHTFKKKYPLGTIHFLLGILGSCFNIEIKPEAICPLLYTDGTFKNIFGYPDNALDWLSFLCASDGNSPLAKIFFNDTYTTSNLMFALNAIFDVITQNGGDGLTVSNSKGEPDNVEHMEGTSLYRVNADQVRIAQGFLRYLSTCTGWSVDDNKWSFDKFHVYRFIKGQMTNPKKGSGGPSLAKQFDSMLGQNPISWAITKASQVQYTLEQDKLN